MKAIVLHEYGGPSNLKLEDFPDPIPGPGEVLVRMHGASINPVDWKMRSGAAKERFPLTFPAILGRDLAGIVVTCGEGVSDFQPGDRVVAMAHATYAELCVVPAAILAHVPEGLDLTDAATLPVVALTGDQLIRNACNAQPGQTILLTGALGSVGRCALFAALQLGAHVIAGVRKHQLTEALSLGATAAIDVADDKAIAALGLVDALADTVGGATATRLLAKVKPGGLVGTIVTPPPDTSLHPTLQLNRIMAVPDPAALLRYAEAVRDGKLKLPIDRLLPLAEAAAGQIAAEKGGIGKIVLTA
jgi:NADPH:quinone reductase-like Zn-dependent oxidoreductase